MVWFWSTAPNAQPEPKPEPKPDTESHAESKPRRVALPAPSTSTSSCQRLPPSDSNAISPKPSAGHQKPSVADLPSPEVRVDRPQHKNEFETCQQLSTQVDRAPAGEVSSWEEFLDRLETFKRVQSQGEELWQRDGQVERAIQQCRSLLTDIRALCKAELARDTSIEYYQNKVGRLEEQLELAARQAREKTGALNRAKSTLELNLNQEREMNKQLCRENQTLDNHHHQLRKYVDVVRSSLKEARYELEILNSARLNKGHKWISEDHSNKLLSQQRVWLQGERDRYKSWNSELRAQKNRKLWRLLAHLSKLTLKNDQLKLRVKELNKASQTRVEPGIELAVAREKLSNARQKIRVLEAEKLALLEMDKKATDLEISLRQERENAKTKASKLESACKDAALLLDGDWRYVEKRALRTILKALVESGTLTFEKADLVAAGLIGYLWSLDGNYRLLPSVDW